VVALLCVIVAVIFLQAGSPTDESTLSQNAAVAPVISPMKTGKIVFVKKIGTTRHVFIMNADGSNAVDVANCGVGECYGALSPDGKKIVLERSINGVAIYTMNIDGTGLLRLSPTPGRDARPSWSPDGKQIIFTRILELPTEGQVPKTAVMVMNADGTNVRTILQDTVKFNFAVEPHFSPDGKHIVFMGGNAQGQHIYTMNADGTHVTQLTHEGSNGDPIYSQDGTRISFGSTREGGGKLNIFTMKTDGTDVRQITHFVPPYEAGDTSWSPDSKYIAFEWDVDGKGQSDPNVRAEVWIVPSDGSGEAQTTGQSCASVGCAPRWQSIGHVVPIPTSTPTPIPATSTAPTATIDARSLITSVPGSRTFTGTASNVTTLQLVIAGNGSTLSPGVTVSDGKWLWQTPGSLPTGSYTVTVKTISGKVLASGQFTVSAPGSTFTPSPSATVDYATLVPTTALRTITGTANTVGLNMRISGLSNSFVADFQVSVVNGKWTWTNTDPLPAGNYLILLKSPEGISLTGTQFTVASAGGPSAPSATISAASLSSTAASYRTLSGTVANIPGVAITISGNNVTLTAGAENKGGYWGWIIPAVLPNGTYSVTVKTPGGVVLTTGQFAVSATTSMSGQNYAQLASALAALQRGLSFLSAYLSH
jgi:Tol biopolymer transport system component